LNRLSMFEPNRVSYLVVDVTSEGDVTLTWKGSPPEAANDATIAPSTFFQTQFEITPQEDRPPTCAAPLVFAALSASGLAVIRAGRARVGRTGLCERAALADTREKAAC
jgi:hypothetical protein